jgi:hypothetical protein
MTTAEVQELDWEFTSGLGYGEEKSSSRLKKGLRLLHKPTIRKRRRQVDGEISPKPVVAGSYMLPKCKLVYHCEATLGVGFLTANISYKMHLEFFKEIHGLVNSIPYLLLCCSRLLVRVWYLLPPRWSELKFVWRLTGSTQFILAATQQGIQLYHVSFHLSRKVLRLELVANFALDIIVDFCEGASPHHEGR